MNDIDIDIRDNDFPKIFKDVKNYAIYGPAHYVDERWDCKLMTLRFGVQEIDISGADSMKICDAQTGVWRQYPADFDRVEKIKIFGMEIPVINKYDLVKYKSMLAGAHQKEDIHAILRSVNKLPNRHER